MRRLELDATRWRSVADFYDDLLRALGACAGHRRSPDALIESMIWGGLTEVAPPYVVSVTGLEAACPAVRAYVSDISHIIADARAWRRANTGVDVEVGLVAEARGADRAAS